MLSRAEKLVRTSLVVLHLFPLGLDVLLPPATSPKELVPPLSNQRFQSGRYATGTFGNVARARHTRAALWLIPTATEDIRDASRAEI
ncbi:uncharacterized protein BO95DRAFT_439555 [Aspergillus brunneoviolaceus CBS 621.78]|uniref:Uncharacterized protein n=1 Tax=Aspergillus brunneoviolaceus CBS 621.78 TaxID=1450534 RepID=A0ACD1GJ29_9EURO|nr:hypothetical protein BO95DRAFT_439555 [Aspergillus brunneoviolaceus CBS 621.78]RAH49271.1 hypothetical protein BO95DRAFT_439555 [Aspergillus brunneoviolaceus CBS 621.78]